MTTQDPMIHIREVLDEARSVVATWALYPLELDLLGKINSALAALDQPSLKDDDVERVAQVIERSLIRHGVKEQDIEGTRDDAIEAMSVSSCGSGRD